MIVKIKKYLKIIPYLIGLAILVIAMVSIINRIITSKSGNFIYSDINNIPKCYTGIVLGAFVSNSGYLSNILQDRMDNAIDLYKAKKINRFLLSGDHGQITYDEVNSMKSYLLDHGIDSSDIFLDHAGFDTYSSMYRAKEIFQVKDAIVITQTFHLPRAVYIARSMDLNAFGFSADNRRYSSIDYLKKREILANVKAFFELLIQKKPRFLGPKIPINGKSELSYD